MPKSTNAIRKTEYAGHTGKFDLGHQLLLDSLIRHAYF